MTPEETKPSEQQAVVSRDAGLTALRAAASSDSRAEKRTKSKRKSKSRSSKSLSSLQQETSSLPVGRSEDHYKKMTQHPEGKVTSEYKAGGAKASKPMPEVSRIVILPSEADKVGDTEVNAESEAESDADADAIAIANVHADADAESDPVTAAADEDTLALALASTVGTDASAAKTPNNGGQLKLIDLKSYGRKSKLERGLDICNDISSSSSSNSKDQSEISNSSGVSILEGAAILTPQQAKWRGYAPIYADINNLEFSTDNDADYYATTYLEEDSIEHDKIFHAKALRGRDTIHKNLFYLFSTAYKRYLEADGDAYSPWLTESTSTGRSERVMSNLRRINRVPRIKVYKVEQRAPSSSWRMQRKWDEVNNKPRRGPNFKYGSYVYSIPDASAQWSRPMVPLGSMGVHREHVVPEADSADTADATDSADAADAADAPSSAGSSGLSALLKAAAAADPRAKAKAGAEGAAKSVTQPVTQPAQVRFIDNIWERHQNMRARANIRIRRRQEAARR